MGAYSENNEAFHRYDKQIGIEYKIEEVHGVCLKSCSV